MNAIKLISWIHVLWGLSLIFIGIDTRPFGQLEAFLVLAERMDLPLYWVGLIFSSSGLFALLVLQFNKNFHHLPILVPMGLMPQQVILLMSLFFAVNDVLYHFDDRIWYAGITQFVFAAFHTMGMYVLYKVVIIGNMVNGPKGKRDASPPY